MCVFSMKHISCCEPVDSGLSQEEILLMPSSKRNWNIPGFPKSPDWLQGQPSLMVQHGDSDTTLFLSASIHRDHFFQVTTGSKPERHHTLPLKALEISVSYSIDFSPLFSFTLSVSVFHFSWTKNMYFTQYTLQRSCPIQTRVNSTSSGSFGSV